MYTTEVDQTLQRIIKVFYYFGAWQIDAESNFRKVVKRFCHLVLSAMVPIFLAANAILCNDKSESIISVQIAVIAAVIFVKCSYVLFKKREILEFLNDQTVTHSIEDREEYVQINLKIKKFMKFVRAYIVIIIGCWFFLVFLQLPMLSDEKALPLFLSFSWRNQDSEVVYWLTFVCLSLALFFYQMFNLLTVFIWYIMLNYSIEYKLLGNRFRKLGTEPNAKPIKKKANRKATNKKNSISAASNLYVANLVVLIKAHQNLAGTIDRFKSHYFTLFLAQITTSGIVICTSVYNLTYASNENIFQILFFVAVLLYGVFDIFFVMYFANEITAASDQLSYCLFESNWIDQTEWCKKYVLIMGEVLKQPQQLMILIYPMNLETFTKIVKGGYSMFNILKSFQ